MNRENLDTPVLFLIFNRPDTTKRVFAKIREAKPKQLFIAADGPRAHVPEDTEKCRKAREIATQVDWDCEVKTLFREENLGCRKSVSEAISWFFENVEEGIILEDDCLSDISFFSYCQNLLGYYRDNDQIMMISGDNFQNGKKRGSASYYFSRNTHVWGWATWRSAWNKYETNLDGLDRFIRSSIFAQTTNSNTEKKYWTNIFTKVRDNKINSWAYVWRYSIWKNNGITIIPNVNLVSNIGFGNDATHTKTSESPLSNMKTEAILNIVHPNNIKISKKGRYIYISPNLSKGVI